MACQPALCTSDAAAPCPQGRQSSQERNYDGLAGLADMHLCELARDGVAQKIGKIAQVRVAQACKSVIVVFQHMQLVVGHTMPEKGNGLESWAAMQRHQSCMSCQLSIRAAQKSSSTRCLLLHASACSSLHQHDERKLGQKTLRFIAQQPSPWHRPSRQSSMQSSSSAKGFQNCIWLYGLHQVVLYAGLDSFLRRIGGIRPRIKALMQRTCWPEYMPCLACMGANAGDPMHMGPAEPFNPWQC